MHVVLVEPEIPQNTGSVARVCAGTGTHLHLVGQLGFSLGDRYLKRAGLDYWPAVKLHVWENLEALRRAAGPAARFHFYSSGGSRLYAEASYAADDYLVFGRESVGLGAQLLERERENTYRIPHAPTIRSLNLANAVSVVVYEGLRQLGFRHIEAAQVVAQGAEGPASAWRRVG